MESLSGASAVSLGRAAAGFQSGVPLPTNSAFADFGSDVRGMLQRASPWVKGGGYAIAFYSVGASTISGYRSGGVAAATSNLGYSSMDAILGFGLADAFGPFGIPLPYGLDRIGGAQTVMAGGAAGVALQECERKRASLFRHRRIELPIGVMSSNGESSTARQCVRLKR
jgi:hypothetical protein